MQQGGTFASGVVGVHVGGRSNVDNRRIIYNYLKIINNLKNVPYCDHDVFIQECHCNFHLFSQVFFCHRSDYFKALFEFLHTAATNQEEDCRITIHDVTPAVFAVVVAYLYIDDAEVGQGKDILLRKIVHQTSSIYTG